MGAQMHVEIKTTKEPMVENVTLNFGGDKPKFRVGVTVDGTLKYAVRCDAYDVLETRNRECERWSEVADSVHADPIPDEERT